MLPGMSTWAKKKFVFVLMGDDDEPTAFFGTGVNSRTLAFQGL